MVAGIALLLSLVAAWAPLYTQENRVDGSYIVVFNDRPQDFSKIEEVEAWLTSNFNGISNVTKSVYLINPQGRIRFRGFSAHLTAEQVQVLQLSPDIAYIEEDSVVSISPINASSADANDWGITRVDHRCTPYTDDKADPCSPVEGAPEDCTGSTVVAWVVDTGIRLTHVEFGGRAIFSFNSAAGSYEPYNGDCNGHGTHVAGSIGGKTYGVAKEVELRAVRVLNCQGSGTNAGVVDGYNHIAANVVPEKLNLLSASLGGGFSQSSNDAINAVADKGVVCVVAAGNNNANACNYSPASATRVITVGATTNSPMDNRASFSNFGTCVDIFAPGTSITSAYYTSDTATAVLSGTSMATPLVSGSISTLGAKFDPSFESLKKLISSYATANVVINPGTGSPNYFAYDRWDDGTSTTC